ncbi:MAG: Sec-independent protein translocase protein TatB [Acidobacteriota bacterium]|nr:Sec-independent protein translocase protein TatB [Acidobacteriota bacterium]
MPALSPFPLMIGPLGMQEMLIILVVALIVFGPRKLPQIGKTLGKSIAEFRRTSTELRSTLEREVQMEEFRAARSEVSELKKDVSDLGRGLDPDRGSGPPGAGREERESPPEAQSAADAPPDASGVGEATDRAAAEAEAAGAGEPPAGDDAASDDGAAGSESRGDSGK